MSGLLKRKFKEVDEDPCYSSPSSLSSAGSGWDSEGESCYSDTLDSNPSNPSSPATNYNSEYASSISSSSALTLCELEIHFLEPCFLLHKGLIFKHVNRRWLNMKAALSLWINSQKQCQTSGISTPFNFMPWSCKMANPIMQHLLTLHPRRP